MTAPLPQAARPVLRTTLTSPYGRKIRMAALATGTLDRFDIVAADTRNEEDDLRQQNPLGKMPCLLIGEDILFDSRVIMEYLDALAGGGRLIPPAGMERLRCLTLSCLADGVTDAALLMVYEGRFRTPEQASDIWMAHQRGKVERGLTRLQAAPPDPQRTDTAAISLACCLGYLDWRRPVEWRDRWSGLVDWLTRFASAEPAFHATEAPK